MRFIENYNFILLIYMNTNFKTQYFHDYQTDPQVAHGIDTVYKTFAT